MPINKEDIPKYRTSSPTKASQSDAPIVVKVADLIEMAMGPTDKNTVNFKMIQTILYILARNMRLLDQHVELKSTDATQTHHSTKESVKTADFAGPRPVWTESNDRQKSAQTTAKGKKIAERDKSKDREKTEWDRNKMEKEDTASSSPSYNMDEIMDKYSLEKEKTKEYHTKPEKFALIRKTYLHDDKKNASERTIKGGADRYIDKDKSLDEKQEAQLAKVDRTDGGKHMKEKGKKEITKHTKKESKYLASSSSSIKYDSSDDDENQMAMLTYEIERIEADSEMEQEEKLAKIAKIREMLFQEQEREKAKVATMNDEEKDKYLKNKDKGKIAKEREWYEKEKAKLAKLDDKERKEYLISKEEKDKAKRDAEESNRSGYKKRESLLDKEESKRANLEQREKYMANLANMNEREREIYLKKKEMEERDLSKDRNRADSDNEKEQEKERKRYETELLQLEKMNVEEKEKYLKEKAQRERAKLDAMGIDRTEGDKKNESEMEKDLKQKVKAEIKQAKNMDKELRDKENESEKNEKEMAKLAKMNDDEKEKYLREQKEQAKLGALDRERAEKEIDEKEKAKIALMNETEREKYLKQKEKAKLDAKDREREDRDNEKDSELYQKEFEKLANMDDEEKENYLRDKEERDKANLDTQDRETTGREMDEKEKTKIALMNETEREKYLKQKEKEGIEKSKLDALNRERAEGEEKQKKEQEREMDEKEKTKIALMNETEREKYLEQKEKEEREKLKLDALDRERAERERKQEKEREQEMDEKEKMKIALMNETEREKYLKQKEKEEREKLKLDALDRERAERERKQEKEREQEIDEKEKAKIALMNEIEREKYLKQKEKEEREKLKLDALDRERAERERKQEKEREKEMDEKEKKKIALMTETERKKYLKQKEKEEREKLKLDALDRERAERERKQEKEREKEMDEKEKKKIALMTETERKKYLKQKEKEEREKLKLDALDRERAERERKQEKEREQEMDEKEKKKIALMTETERKKYLKQKEKEEREKSKLYALDRKRAERERKQEKEREQEIDEKEKAKIALMTETERKTYLKQKEKEEREKSKLDALNRERAEREKKRDKERERETEREQDREKYRERKIEQEREQGKEKESETNVKEKKWAKAKVGSGTRTPHVDSRTRVGSIEVVTRSEFELLEAKVNELQDKTAPIPYPSMPDNQKLRTDLASGSASLTDTMQAMQVSSRVQATESAMGRMADLLTQLAAAGALPQDVMKQVEEVTAGIGRPAPGEALSRGELASRSVGTSSSHGLPGRSVGTVPMDGVENTISIGVDDNVRSVGTAIDERIRSVGFGTDNDETTRSAGTETKKYTGVTSASRAHFHFSSCVTHPELDDAQRELKDSMLRRANNMVLKAVRLAEIADMNVKHVSDQMEIATKVATRINDLFSLVNDYAEQLAGFDAGVTEQMQNFRDQMFQTRCELNDGITMLNLAIANPETEAVRMLKQKYEDLVIDLDVTRNTLDTLGYFQNGIGGEMASIKSSVEALRAEKADRDELLDRIRDKAHNRRLDGLLKQLDFEPARMKLDHGLDACYNKFKQQDEVWTRVVEDLMAFAISKASGNQLYEFTYKMETDLNNIKDELQLLSASVGEPKAVLLTRKISEGGTCGPCQAPARQEAMADCQPPLMPALRRHPPIEEEPCTLLVKQPRQLEEREHICNRWTGGSHTLINKSVVHQDSGDNIIRMNMPPTKKFAGVGRDGRVYQLEEVLQPCGDCNQPGQEEEKKVQEEEKKVPEEGAGEPGIKKVQLKFDRT